MRNRNRFITGLVVLTIGIVLIVIAINAMYKISAAQSMTQNLENFFSHNPDWNPIIKFFGGKAQHKISSYQTMAVVTLILGAILTVYGTMTAFFKRKKTR